MKSRSKGLSDRAISATVAAIEIYNKPDFRYREETFSVLAINGWELLLKSKWLTDNSYKVRSLYVLEPRIKKDGTKGKQLQIKKTRSGNPYTHGIDFLAKQLIQKGSLDSKVWANIQALLEVRDPCIHFYNRTGAFSVRLQEIGAASLKNFVALVKEWFGRDLTEFNFYLMPLSFVTLPQQNQAIVLNKEEKNFLTYLESLEPDADNSDSAYSVTVNIDVKFTRSKAKDALGVRVTSNPDAPEVRLTDEQVQERYPWNYKRLTEECCKRYSDFKQDKNYHTLRKKLLGHRKFGLTRYLDPSNSKGTKKPFFNPNILPEFDKHYTKIK